VASIAELEMVMQEHGLKLYCFVVAAECMGSIECGYAVLLWLRLPEAMQPREG
jgi:hypothetical protein